MKRFFLLVAILTTACTPRFYPPQTDLPVRYVNDTTAYPAMTELDSCWWRMFGDTTLNRLIERALTNNRDLAAAAARIEEVRANLGIVRAQYLPQLGAGIAAGGSYTDATRIVQSYAVEPSLSWEVSLFGALRNTRRSARAQIAASLWAYTGVRLSLAAEVATAYFELLEYEHALSIARRSCELRRESAVLIDSMHRYGMSDGVALAQARSLVYEAEADIPRYERAVEETRLSLGLLLGEARPQPAAPGTAIRLEAIAQPVEIPVGIPSDLLARRPDLMENRYTLLAAAAEVGVARSARFPSIGLTAKGGVASASLKGLTSSNPWSWNAAGSITAPIFAFGKLKRSEQAAMARYEQAARQYEQAVLSAFSEVETVLDAIETYRRQTARYSKLVAVNERIDEMTQALYRSGLADYFDVLNTQRDLYNSQMQLANLVAQQYINYVDLCKALGGGFRVSEYQNVQ